MIQKIFYNICAFIFRIFFTIKYHPTILGQENIPKKGRLILVANHQSNYDFISLAIGTKRQVHFLAKKSLFKGILKPIMYGVGAIPINRQKKNSQAIKKTLYYLEQEEIVGIFPEGTFSKEKNTLNEFKIGAVKIATLSNAPIIPITIIGAYKRNELVIKIDKPFYVKSNDLKKENNILREQIIKNIRGIS